MGNVLDFRTSLPALFMSSAGTNWSFSILIGGDSNNESIGKVPKSQVQYKTSNGLQLELMKETVTQFIQKQFLDTRSRKCVT